MWDAIDPGEGISPARRREGGVERVMPRVRNWIPAGVYPRLRSGAGMSGICALVFATFLLGAFAESGGRRFPPLQQYRKPRRRRGRLQGRRRLDHGGLGSALAHLRKPSSRAISSARYWYCLRYRLRPRRGVDGASLHVHPATRSSPFAASPIVWRAVLTAPASSRSIPANSARLDRAIDRIQASRRRGGAALGRQMRSRLRQQSPPEDRCRPPGRSAPTQIAPGNQNR